MCAVPLRTGRSGPVFETMVRPSASSWVHHAPGAGVASSVSTTCTGPVSVEMGASQRLVSLRFHSPPSLAATGYLVPIRTCPNAAADSLCGLGSVSENTRGGTKLLLETT